MYVCVRVCTCVYVCVCVCMCVIECQSLTTAEGSQDEGHMAQLDHQRELVSLHATSVPRGYLLGQKGC